MRYIHRIFSYPLKASMPSGVFTCDFASDSGHVDTCKYLLHNRT